MPNEWSEDEPVLIRPEPVRAAQDWSMPAQADASTECVERPDAVTQARQAVADAVEWGERQGIRPPSFEVSDVPLTDQAIQDRTTDNRINLADDIPATRLTTEYGGYLDVVMHGDETGTQADIEGQRVDFTLDGMAEMIEVNPEWQDRPIRLMSCETGAEDFAQDLADRLGVPVYAPDDLLYVDDDGSTSLPDGGSWHRFEPDWDSVRKRG